MMIYTTNTINAMKILFNQQKDQVDKSGMPYVFHPWHVAEQMTDETTTIVALLHDVIEDTDMTLEDLEEYHFNEEIIAAICAITHNLDVAYDDYIKGVSNNPIATKVKIEDIRHNSDHTRLDQPEQTNHPKIEKYKKSFAYLTSLNSEYNEGIYPITQMIYSPVTKKAIKLMFEQLRNQTDRLGIPAVFHPWHIAEQMPDENTTVVALLFDVIKLTDTSLDDIKNMGFNSSVINALYVLK